MGLRTAASQDLHALARRLHDELLLTPRRDPWLGLAAAAVYSDLLAGGRRSPVSARALAPGPPADCHPDVAQAV